MYPRWLSISLSMRELSGAAASPSLETLLLSSSGPSRRIEEGSRTGGRRRTRGVGGIRHAERRPHHRGADRLGALVRARGGQRCPRDLSGHQGAHGALRPERQSVDDHIDMAVRIGVLPDSRMVATRVARHCGSPHYFAAHGTPKMPSDLADHTCVTFAGMAAGTPLVARITRPTLGAIGTAAVPSQCQHRGRRASTPPSPRWDHPHALLSGCACG
jgi:hypothetical protein